MAALEAARVATQRDALQAQAAEAEYDASLRALEETAQRKTDNVASSDGAVGSAEMDSFHYVHVKDAKQAEATEAAHITQQEAAQARRAAEASEYERMPTGATGAEHAATRDERSRLESNVPQLEPQPQPEPEPEPEPEPQPQLEPEPEPERTPTAAATIAQRPMVGTSPPPPPPPPPPPGGMMLSNIPEPTLGATSPSRPQGRVTFASVPEQESNASTSAAPADDGGDDQHIRSQLAKQMKQKRALLDMAGKVDMLAQQHESQKDVASKVDMLVQQHESQKDVASKVDMLVQQHESQKDVASKVDMLVQQHESQKDVASKVDTLVQQHESQASPSHLLAHIHSLQQQVSLAMAMLEDLQHASPSEYRHSAAGHIHPAATPSVAATTASDGVHAAAVSTEADGLHPAATRSVAETFVSQSQNGKHRQAHVMMRMVISRMRSNTRESVFWAWHAFAQHRVRVARLLRKALFFVEQGAVVRTFSPWLATARTLRFRQLQERQNELQSSLEQTHNTIQEREREIEQRVEAAAKERRKRLIEKQLIRIIDELQKKSIAQSLFAWHVWVAHRIRTRIIAAKADVVVANTTLRSSFSPWLLAARAANALVQQRTIVTLILSACAGTIPS
eukprot:COSAG02_NODE_7912_length_2794_cov_1.803340_2_plen_623_part_00